ncbi:MAG: two-component system response regulator [Nitrospira sp. WS238]|nr:two-component system response regulator [Nitrospira sp. WS238]
MPETLDESGAIPTILVVDDDSDLLAAVSDRLTAEGFQVVTACSGIEALSCMQVCAPALVLLDFHMPGMNGAETLQSIRRAHPTLPVIMMTGANRAELQQRHQVLCNADEFLQKPIHWRLLQRTMQCLLGHSPGDIHPE